MFSVAATDAGKGKTNASKAIPAGLSEDPQAEWKELLVCPVERGGETQIERDRTLLEDGSGEGGSILTEILKPINEGAENPEKITWTFAKFCEVVYLPVCHRKWKASTDMVETNRLEVHLVRPLGAKLMQEITRSELQALLDEQARSCGRSMVDHLRFRLRSVFALAMSEGVVDRNPAAALFTPRHYQEGRSREVLTPDQAAILIGALELREKVIVRLATWEGMRPGEILALQMGDLDDDSVWVRRRVYKGDIDEPKTKRSTRRVALTVGTLAMLDQWKLRLLGSPAETWLFGSEKGTPMRRDNIWRKCMHPKLKPVGLEWATFQVMRRTFANPIEGGRGGCSYPVGADGQFGGCERE
ncbi:MAG: site-specific integrase [Acidobacteriota bacterium]